MLPGYPVAHPGIVKSGRQPDRGQYRTPMLPVVVIVHRSNRRHPQHFCRCAANAANWQTTTKPRLHALGRIKLYMNR